MAWWALHAASQHTRQCMALASCVTCDAHSTCLCHAGMCLPRKEDHSLVMCKHLLYAQSGTPPGCAGAVPWHGSRRPGPGPHCCGVVTRHPCVQVSKEELQAAMGFLHDQLGEDELRHASLLMSLSFGLPDLVALAPQAQLPHGCVPQQPGYEQGMSWGTGPGWDA